SLILACNPLLHFLSLIAACCPPVVSILTPLVRTSHLCICLIPLLLRSHHIPFLDSSIHHILLPCKPFLLVLCLIVLG
ncbi:unnamed protein product, partial [Closterium sp. NIES-53]